MRILHKRKLAFTVLLFLVSLFIAALLGSLAILGGGFILKAILPISLFEASTIFIATIFTMATAVGLADIKNAIRAEQDWEDDIDWDEEDEHDLGEISKKFADPKTYQQTKSISRNQPCPCGSGKKYKNCCLDRAEDQESIPF